jgi:hypothetical protein
VLKKFYKERTRAFIFSISAKSEIWSTEPLSVQPGFSGLSGFLREFSSVCPDIEKTGDIERLKRAVTNFMKGLNGLILFDNLESFTDIDLYNFLSDDIPDPVKVIITSKIDKRFGGKTVSIPAMSAEDSRTLLMYEMSLLGYHPKESEAAHVDDVITLAGGLPLAIKWMAQIAGDERSVYLAYNSFSSRKIQKRSLLSFCFEFMYNSLAITQKTRRVSFRT